MGFGVFGEILILKSPQSDFIHLESEFQQRGVVLRTTTDLKQCLTLVAVHTPKILMVDLDYPHKDIAALPALLKSNFPLTTCGVLSESSQQTMAHFIGTGLREKIFPPLNLEHVLPQLYQLHLDHTLLSKSDSEWPTLEQRCLQVEEILRRYETTFNSGEVLELAQVIEASMAMVMQTIHGMPGFR